MAQKNFLIFDLGASTGRIIVAEYDGKKFNMEVIHRFDSRPVFAAGTLYWDILKLYSELKTGIQASVKKYKSIASIGIDTPGADFGIIGKDGRLISNPVHYRDERRVKDSKSLLEIIPAKKLFELTGASIQPLFDLFHLYSLKVQDAPEILNAGKLLSIADLFNYFLTGETFNELTRITTTILYDQIEKKMEESIFEKLGLPRDIFPPLVTPGKKIGNISSAVSKELEVDPIPVIAPATHDTASAEAGVPVREENSNWAFVSMGTWFCMGIENEAPLISDEIFENIFINEAGVEGNNLFIRNGNGLWVIQQCRERWLKEKENLSWDEIVGLSSRAPAFRSFINIEGPQFGKPPADMPQVIRDYCGKTGQPVPGTIGEVARCVYESLALTAKLFSTYFEKFTGKNIDVLHLVGGGTKNKLLCEWITNSTGKAVIAGPTETTAVGNLLMQLKAEGEIKSLKEGRQISLGSSEVFRYQPENTGQWDEAFERYLKII